MACEDERADGRAGEAPVVVECLSCGRVSSLAGDALPPLPLVELTRRLRCSVCGSRAVRAARSEAADMPGRASGQGIATPRDLARLVRSRMRPGRR